MNKDPNKATKWKGRILMGVEYFESESPKLGVEKMSTTPPVDDEGNEIGKFALSHNLLAFYGTSLRAA